MRNVVRSFAVSTLEHGVSQFSFSPDVGSVSGVTMHRFASASLIYFALTLPEQAVVLQTEISVLILSAFTPSIL